jgi:hypothetical protein
MSRKKPIDYIVQAGDDGKKLRVLSIDVGIVNLALWSGTIDPRNPDDQVTDYWRVVNAPAELGLDWPDVRKKTICVCCDAVDDWLEQKFPLRGEHIDVILIENQPLSTFGRKKSASNPKMFGISLTMRRTLRKLFPMAYMANYVTPKLKLKALPDPEIGNDIEDAGKRYRVHKKATKEYVNTLEGIPEDMGAKKDDLADAYMQARAWFITQEQLRVALAEHKRQVQLRAAERKRVREEKKRLKELEKAERKKKKKTGFPAKLIEEEAE